MASLTEKSPKISKAFTIAEVVMTSFIVVIVMVPILQALTSAHMLDVKIEHRTRSLQLADAKLEDIRARSVYSYDTDFDDSSSSVDGLYLCKVVDSAVSTILRSVQVSVGYDRSNNGVLEDSEVEVTLDTLIAKRW